MVKIVDLFAGCGGLSLGFQNAGFDIVGAFESWRTAVACYEANFEHPIYKEDLSDVQTVVPKIRALAPDIIIGGPPCQDFSHAGKRIEDKRAALTEAFAEIVTAVLPQWFVMENVDRAQKSEAYAVAREIFINSGYGLTEITLDASLCGVPQKRKRFFCIGSLNAANGFLSEYINQRISDKETTLRDYFGSSLDFEYYYRHPRNYSRRAVYSIDEPSPTVRGMNRPVPPGYHGHPNDAIELDDSIRALTTIERAQIQTFPSSFRWVGNKTETEQMIGNAVPVKLAEFVGKALAHYIMECKRSIDFEPFTDWLYETRGFREDAHSDTPSRLKRSETIPVFSPKSDAFCQLSLELLNDYQSSVPLAYSQTNSAVALANCQTTTNANG